MRYHIEQKPDEIYLGNVTNFDFDIYFRNVRYLKKDLKYFSAFVNISQIESAIYQEKLLKTPNWQERISHYQKMIATRTAIWS